MSYTLRVSVAEICQLRCPYCLPNNIINNNFWLSLYDYEKIARALKILPLTKIRFTGGEPLLRKELAKIIQIFKNNFNNTKIALTTNGQYFSKYADDLINSGLSIINFHLDTLKQEKYKLIMGKGSIEKVIQAILQAQELDLKIKLNIVVQKNINTDEIINFLLWGKDKNIKIRFIELMNTGVTQKYVQNKFISGENILNIIRKKFQIKYTLRESPSTPAENYYIPGLDYYFGLIRSDTRPFCNLCNRLRLSSQGELTGCLYEPTGVALRNLDYKILCQKINNMIISKKSYHPIIGVGKRRLFSMSQTGG